MEIENQPRSLQVRRKNEIMNLRMMAIGLKISELPKYFAKLHWIMSILVYLIPCSFSAYKLHAALCCKYIWTDCQFSHFHGFMSVAEGANSVSLMKSLWLWPVCSNVFSFFSEPWALSLIPPGRPLNLLLMTKMLIPQSRFPTLLEWVNAYPFNLQLWC